MFVLDFRVGPSGSIRTEVEGSDLCKTRGEVGTRHNRDREV